MSTQSQKSFSGGEIAPSLYARTDIGKYQNSVRSLRNFIVMRHGGAANRPGTKFVTEALGASNYPVRLVSFVYSDTETYVLEFGENYIRILSGGEPTVYSNFYDITAIENGVGAKVSCTQPFTDGTEIYLYSIKGMSELNNRMFVVSDSVAYTSFKLKDHLGNYVDSTNFDAYVSGGKCSGTILKVTTPYAKEDLFDLSFEQNNELLTITHKNYPPKELKRLGPASWSLSDITLTPTQPAPTITSITGGAGALTYVYHITGINGESYEESLADTYTKTSVAAPSTGSPHVINFSTATGAGEYNIYLEVNGTPGFVGVARSSPFTYDGAALPDTTETPPTDRNPFSSRLNYPASVTYIQQRLAFGGTTKYPEKIWLSRSGMFKNFTTRSPLQDDDAITFKISGKQINEIRHILDLGSFVVLTSSGEWLAEADVLTPTSINLKQQSYFGSSKVKPIIIGNSAVFVQAREKILRDLAYSYNSDGYSGNDLTVFASHLFDKYKIKDMAYQQNPNSVLWVVREDGALLGLTYLKEHQMLAWHRHDFLDVPEAEGYREVSQERSYGIPSLTDISGSAYNLMPTTNYNLLSQSFYVEHPFEPSEISIVFNRIESGFGNFTVSIYEADIYGAIYGSPVATTGNLSSTTHALTTNTEKTFTLTTTSTLRGGKYYAVVIDASALSVGGWIRPIVPIDSDATNGYSMQIPKGTLRLRDAPAGPWVGTSYGAGLAMRLTGTETQTILKSQSPINKVESVCVVPEGKEDVLYLAIAREVDGQTVRYIERMSTREIDDIKDTAFLDSHITYDGRNNSGLGLTLSGGTNWTYDETLTLTADSAYFVSTDVGREIHLYNSDLDIIRCEIKSYSSSTVVTVSPHKTVPASMRSTALTNWAKAVDTVAGLWHLEGKNVAVFGDGYVVASPNNEAYTTVTVTNGQVTLDKCYGVIHVGLPYFCDIETLDIDHVQQETTADKNLNVSGVTLFVEKSRGIWSGAKPPTDDSDDPLENLVEHKISDLEGYDSPTGLLTGKVDINLVSEWNSNGRVFIRQVDPVPLTVLSVAPSGLIP